MILLLIQRFVFVAFGSLPALPWPSAEYQTWPEQCGAFPAAAVEAPLAHSGSPFMAVALGTVASGPLCHSFAGDRDALLLPSDLEFIELFGALLQSMRYLQTFFSLNFLEASDCCA
mmetsp:Transcript_69493/g.134080  ORF Transcript_69493/g.134080 Transcript_69493/m.134080 type:complete len:116 (+) Transcript_69493:1636-1983(+)